MQGQITEGVATRGYSVTVIQAPLVDGSLMDTHGKGKATILLPHIRYFVHCIPGFIDPSLSH